MDKSKLQNLINSKKVNVSSSLVVNNVEEEKSIADKLTEKSIELSSKKKSKVEHIQRTIRLTGMNKGIVELYEEVNNSNLDNALMSSCLGFILAAELLAEENKDIEKSLENLRKLVLPHIRKIKY